MTDTLTDRERELVEAARETVAFWKDHIPFTRLTKSVSAYDPPKVKKYTMPSWEEFSMGRTPLGDAFHGVFVSNEKTGCEMPVFQSSYELARETLATEE